MFSSIRTADVIKAINYFVMTNEVTFTGSGPLVISSAHAPAGTENRNTNNCVGFLYSIVTYDVCCDSFSLPSLIFPAISLVW